MNDRFDIDTYRRLMAEFREFVTTMHGEKVGFANDGPIAPEDWKNQQPKLLVYAKETYGFSGCVECPVMGNPDGWNASRFNRAISRLSFGIHNYVRDRKLLTKQQLFYPGDQLLRDAYAKLAIVEVKKTSNDGSRKTSDDAIVRKHSKQNSALLRRQVQTLAPDVILCCGTVTYHSLAHDLEWRDVHERDLRANEIGRFSRGIAIHSWHPSYSRFNLFDLYSRLIEFL